MSIAFFFPFESFRAAACFFTRRAESPWELAMYCLDSRLLCSFGDFFYNGIDSSSCFSIADATFWDFVTRVWLLCSYISQCYISFWKTRKCSICKIHIWKNMERGIGFEPTHPRVEALVHSLFYVTPACYMWATLYARSQKSQRSPCYSPQNSYIL